MGRKEERARLAGMGTDLGNFNQTDFRGKHDQIEGVELRGGYCAGICLDWTRRVLLSPPGRDSTYLTYSGPKNAIGGPSREPTLRRMATAYFGQTYNYVATTRKTEALRELKGLLNFKGPMVQVSKAAAKAIQSVFDIEDPNPFNMTMEPAGVIERTVIEGWIRDLEGSEDPQHGPLALGGREWGQYSAELDQRYSTSKKKTFGRISVEASSNDQTYESPKVWIPELRSKGFRDNCCTIISVYKPTRADGPSINGHAVAVHQLSSDYLFFDPNYGVFKYPERALAAALVVLFLRNPDTGLPVYGRKGTMTLTEEEDWTQMSYTIFKKNV